MRRHTDQELAERVAKGATRYMAGNAGTRPDTHLIRRLTAGEIEYLSWLHERNVERTAGTVSCGPPTRVR